MGLLQRFGAAVRGLTAGLHPRDPALVELFGGQVNTESGEPVTPDTARRCPEVDACISLNEDTIATVPLDVYEQTGEGEGDRERATGHPLHELLHDSPNTWQSSAEFRQMMEGWRETHSNAYARIIPGGRQGFAKALEPVHPREIRPFRTADGVAYRWTPPDSSSRILMQHEVLHLKFGPPDPRNLAASESVVERHKETIGRMQATSNYLSRYFKNNATPKILIKVPGTLTDTQIEALINQFLARHGRENMHRPVVNHAGMEVSPIGSSNADAQVREIYEQGIFQICRIWDTPPHLIAETSKQTSFGTGVEHQSLGFVQFYMRSKFVVWEQALARALMSSGIRKRFKFEFNMDGLLRGDFEGRMRGYALMVQWGLASRNEIRRRENWPAMSDADEALIPLNMVPASRIMDVLLKVASSPEGRAMVESLIRENAETQMRMLAKPHHGVVNGH